MRLVLVLALLAGCQGDPVKCDQGCRNFAALAYWRTADVEIAKLPPAQRDAARKTKLAEYNKYLETGIDMCVTQCQSASRFNNDGQIDCLIAAHTADQAQACLK
jgi:hypothetical protein